MKKRWVNKIFLAVSLSTVIASTISCGKTTSESDGVNSDKHAEYLVYENKWQLSLNDK